MNATQAYMEKLEEIGALLKAIDSKVKYHLLEATEEGINWGHVADLTYIKSKLEELTGA